eukprot:CAMPEP_0197420384 /NCGR_PEP_ID=MMETSP1170-20131217/5834_1 /TAXON_ID=54406 /ORGANISM="Sarcinochrysis sp, Strain CCMP770" /LENGTH=65 /DNA_ID=CAMNT_0042947545 /DNA_START=44 /DNA_END=238 /DNA_ORIENTATION=-
MAGKSGGSGVGGLGDVDVGVGDEGAVDVFVAVGVVAVPVDGGLEAEVPGHFLGPAELGEFGVVDG